MEPHDNIEAAPRRKTLRWIAAVFFADAGLNLILGKWPEVVFFIVSGLLFLKAEALDRLPKPTRVLILLGFAALVAAMFVKVIIDTKARG